MLQFGMRSFNIKPFSSMFISFASAYKKTSFRFLLFKSLSKISQCNFGFADVSMPS
jgi:hypothetical protein